MVIIEFLFYTFCEICQAISGLFFIEKPIDTTGYTRDNKDDLIKTVRSVICEVFEKGEKIDTSA